MKKKIQYLLIAVCSLALVGGFSACTKKKNTQSGNPTIEKVAELSLSKKNAVLQPGATLTLEPVLTNITKDEAVSFQWKSYDTDVVTVENGVVTAQSFGTTNVSVSYGLLNASCKITVQAASYDSDEYLLQISQSTITLNAFYADGKSASLTVSAYKNGEAIEAQYAWESDNTEYVTVDGGRVTALKNGGDASVTVSATVDGVRLTSVCKVYTRDEVVIDLTAPNKVLEPSEEYVVPVSITVNGEVTSEQPVWRSLDRGVAVVSDGRVTAIGGGKTTIEATYGGATQSIEVSVRTYAYISTAEQFLAIGQGDETYAYMLSNNIDMGAYLAENPWINDAYLIEALRGTFDGRGYAITGLSRYYNASERTLSGLFEIVAKSAKISNLHLELAINTSKTGSLFAKQMSGTIENCYIELTLNGVSGAGAAYSLFSSSIGSVNNTIVKIASTESITAFSTYGFVKCDGCLVVADGVACGGTVNGVGTTANPYLNDCYLYESESALLSGDGKQLNGDGAGAAVSGVKYTDFDASVWSFDGTIALKNESNTTAFKTPVTGSAGDRTIDLTQTYTIADQTKAGLLFDCYILNERGARVHTLAEDGATFAPTLTGTYTVVTSLTDTEGGTGYNVAMLTVKNATELKLKTKSFVLKVGETATVVLETEKAATDFAYYAEKDTIASVDANGAITAKFKGITQVLIVDRRTGLSATVTVEVVNAETITEIGTAEQLLALDGVSGGYYLLTNDIKLTWSDAYNYQLKVNDSRTENYARMLHSFDGVLDGNGHTLTLEYVADNTKYIPCGVFYELGENSVVKNLHYVFNGEYARPNMSQYVGLFAYNARGTMQNCYFEASVEHLKNSYTLTDQEGFIAVATKPTGVSGTGFFNCLFYLSITDENGKAADQGYAIRFGSRGPSVEHCVFVRNGATKAFFGTNANNGSACEMRFSYFYRTLYDLVHAKNGVTINTVRVVTPISDNAPVYSDWESCWKFTSDGIYLLNRRVAEVTYEDYGEAPVMELTHSDRLLTWTESGTFDVSINGKRVGSTSDGSFEIFEAIAELYTDVAGTYDVIVENTQTGMTGIAILKIVGVTQDNFVEIVRQKADQVENAHYVLLENITLSVNDFAQGKGGDLYVSTELYTPLDGNGYTVKVEGDLSSKVCGALFYDVYTTVRNLSFRYNVTRKVRPYTGCFATNIVRGGLFDCYFNVTVTPLDESGSATAADVTVFHHGIATAQYKNNVFVVRVLDESGAVTERGAVVNKNSGGPVYDGCVLVHEKLQTKNTPSWAVVPANGFVKNARYYASEENFIGGSGFVTESTQKFLEQATWTASTDKVYEGWGELWTVTENKISLCGKAVYPEIRTLGASLNGNTLTVTDTAVGIYRSYDVYVNDVKAVSFSGASCNVVSLLEKAGKLAAGANNLKIKVVANKGIAAQTSVLDLNVYGIADSNFVETVRKAQVDVGSFYYVMLEDVALDSSDYSSAQAVWNVHTVSSALYVDIDGNGHTLSVTGKLATLQNAVFGSIYGKVQNLVFKYNVSRYETKDCSAFFGLVVQKTGVLENCYMEANVLYVTDANGTPATALTYSRAPMIHSFNGSTTVNLRNIITVVNVLNEELSGVPCSFSYQGAGGRTVENCVVIGSASNRKIAVAETNAQFKTCYYYDTLSDFVSGTNGKYLSFQNSAGKNESNTATAEWTDADGKSVSAFGKSASVTRVRIKL